MKHLFSIALLVLAVSAIMVSSCKKNDFTCTCKLSNGTTKEKWIGYLPNDAAQKQCNDYQLELANNPNGIVPICKVVY